MAVTFQFAQIKTQYPFLLTSLLEVAKMGQGLTAAAAAQSYSWHLTTEMMKTHVRFV